ncbi:hypothetical protein RPYSC3_09210 [Rhodopseudomonas palustris]|nr:hypothetical protein RPYSC3_09210 [Rhodopseudomonas palustris]
MGEVMCIYSYSTRLSTLFLPLGGGRISTARSSQVDGGLMARNA